MSNNTEICQATLRHFSGGGQNYFDAMSKRFGYQYTEGVRYLRHNGCDWLVSDMIIKLGMDPKVKDTHSVKFIPDGEGGGTTVYYTTNPNTGESVEIDRQEYDSTSIDFKVSFLIGACVDRNKVYNLLLLLSEY